MLDCLHKIAENNGLKCISLKLNDNNKQNNKMMIENEINPILSRAIVKSIFPVFKVMLVGPVNMEIFFSYKKQLKNDSKMIRCLYKIKTFISKEFKSIPSGVNIEKTIKIEIWLAYSYFVLKFIFTLYFIFRNEKIKNPDVT